MFEQDWVQGALLALFVLIAAVVLVYGARLFVGIVLVALGLWALFHLFALLR